jgi:hypothetical protein
MLALKIGEDEMTQRILKTSINECAVNVLMGWDRALQYYFMVINYVDSDDEPLYSNLDDDDAGINIKNELPYFLKKARSFNIKIPEAMIARLQADKTLNLGNEKSFFNEDCTEPTIKSMLKKILKIFLRPIGI